MVGFSRALPKLSLAKKNHSEPVEQIYPVVRWCEDQGHTIKQKMGHRQQKKNTECASMTRSICTFGFFECVIIRHTEITLPYGSICAEHFCPASFVSLRPGSGATWDPKDSCHVYNACNPRNGHVIAMRRVARISQVCRWGCLCLTKKQNQNKQRCDLLSA